MKFATSKDGARIAYETTGQGPLLLLVHGVLGEHRRWDAVTALLAPHFTVAAMDRRGRGQSTDGPAYSFEREVEDVAAVADALGGPVHVLGHSFGAAATIEASKQAGAIRSIILYEPTLRQGPLDTSPRPDLDAIEAQALAGDREGALRAFYHVNFNNSDAEIEAIKAAGYWQERLSVIHTAPREVRVVRNYRFDPAAVAHVQTPVLFLLGAKSPAPFVQSAELAAGAFPNIQTVVLEGQGHFAMATNPQLLAGEVLRFLDGLGEHAPPAVGVATPI